jgi:N-acetylglucosamine-6-phosphate deacetylase
LISDTRAKATAAIAAAKFLDGTDGILGLHLEGPFITRSRPAEGLSGVTHLFNAMPARSAREPGIVGVALTDERLTAGIILDGIHVDPLAAG